MHVCVRRRATYLPSFRDARSSAQTRNPEGYETLLDSGFARSARPGMTECYSIGKPRGFGPRGKARSSADISSAFSTSSPAAALSAA